MATSQATFLTHEEAIGKSTELLEKAKQAKNGGADLAYVTSLLTEAQVYATLALALRPHW